MSKRIYFSVESADGGFIIESAYSNDNPSAENYSFSKRGVVTTAPKVVKSLKEVLSKLENEVPTGE